MTAQLIDAMVSLTALMEEESEKIARKAYVPELGEIAAAKLRLTGRIEADFARLKRESADWAEKLDEETRIQLSDASRNLRDASAVNQQILSRQIELSVEMMGAIAAEAQRLTGTRSTTYGACGGLGGMDAPAPISINARL
ncbi:flagellar protein FlgN [Sphingomonas psychrotolerans]|uniref:Flagellar protein FlgN n=1 Tax=Sphingomonas psychrotolerans TaxID=1327635 RepID=A0ABU3MXX5_9SPHN|nr:flagellar protein FlgN [Sphingomonas psychrotolerans]MDT8757068.1 flagellar protein FlgN [Sphingomonas psychrotolerans]